MSVEFYRDGNGNCIYDAGTDPVMFAALLVEVDSVNVPIDTISCISGFTYTAHGNLNDEYTFKAILPWGMVATCPLNGTVTDIIQGGINPTQYIGLDCTANDFDLSTHVSSQAGIHAFEAYIYADNWSCAPQNAIITMNYDPSYNLSDSDPAPSSQSPGVVSWNISALPAFQGCTPIYIYLNGVQLPTGTPVTTTYSISPTIGDADPSNNMMVVIDTVTGGWDPNAIYAKPSGCVTAGTKLEYTITFENLGNGPAENIYVLDTLPPGLDASSMLLQFASHEMYVEKIYNGEQVIFKFNFPNIMLPDSTSPDRHGMLVYTIDTKSTLPFGASMNHDASIYFDYNPPVLTNTAQTGICWPAGVSKASKNRDKIELYPNPATDELTLKTEQQYNVYTITNSIGQTMLQQPLNGKEVQVNIKNLAPGMYYISLQGDRGMEVRKFVKM